MTAHVDGMSDDYTLIEPPTVGSAEFTLVEPPTLPLPGLAAIGRPRFHAAEYAAGAVIVDEQTGLISPFRSTAAAMAGVDILANSAPVADLLHWQIPSGPVTPVVAGE